jgi:hypothetical protein
MLLSFHWYKYSFVFGIQIKDAKAAANPGGMKAGVCEGMKMDACEWGNAGLKSAAVEEDYDFFHIAGSARQALKSGIREAGIKKPCKEELLIFLLHLLKPYPALTVLPALPFRVAINNVIQKDSVTYCSIHLNNEELQTLWRKVR